MAVGLPSVESCGPSSVPKGTVARGLFVCQEREKKEWQLLYFNIRGSVWVPRRTGCQECTVPLYCLVDNPQQ